MRTSVRLPQTSPPHPGAREPPQGGVGLHACHCQAPRNSPLPSTVQNRHATRHRYVHCLPSRQQLRSGGSRLASGALSSSRPRVARTCSCPNTTQTRRHATRTYGWRTARSPPHQGAPRYSQDCGAVSASHPRVLLPYWIPSNEGHPYEFAHTSDAHRVTSAEALPPAVGRRPLRLRKHPPPHP